MREFRSNSKRQRHSVDSSASSNSRFFSISTLFVCCMEHHEVNNLKYYKYHVEFNNILKHNQEDIVIGKVNDKLNKSWSGRLVKNWLEILETGMLKDKNHC